jgi:hypothetical protein
MVMVRKCRTVQLRPPRPFTAKAVARTSSYAERAGEPRGVILVSVMKALDYDLECIHKSFVTAFERRNRIDQAREQIAAGRRILESLLVAATLSKWFAFLRPLLRSVIATMKAVETLLQPVDGELLLCADAQELLTLIREGR